MKLIRPHIEWIALLSGLILMAMMDPTIQGNSFCLWDRLGFNFCPGEGLGHSIAYLFRGELVKSIDSHLLGSATVLVLSSRIIQCWFNLIRTHTIIQTSE